MVRSPEQMDLNTSGARGSAPVFVIAAMDEAAASGASRNDGNAHAGRGGKRVGPARRAGRLTYSQAAPVGRPPVQWPLAPKRARWPASPRLPGEISGR